MSWKARIRLAKKTGSFTQDDEALASDFETCAVGEQLGPLPAPPIPLTDDVFQLGQDFFDAVEDGDIEEASQIYRKISAKARSAT